MQRLRAVPFAIGDTGRLAAEVRVGAPLGLAAGPEIELAEHDVRGVAVRGASIRGLSHRHRGTERQDAFLCSWNAERGALFIAVADGVGSKKRSREVSTAAVKMAAEAWAQRRSDLIDIVSEVNAYLADSVPRNKDGYRVGATTLTLVEIPVEGGELGTAEVAWVGDTPVWTLSSGVWMEVTPQDDDGEGFAAPISALPRGDLEVRHAVAPAASDALFVMTDGVGNAIRNSSEVRSTLAGWWAEPPGIYTFGAQVEFARKGFIDDRTVVGVWADAVAGSPSGDADGIERPLDAEAGTETSGSVSTAEQR